MDINSTDDIRKNMTGPFGEMAQNVVSSAWSALRGDGALNKVPAGEQKEYLLELFKNVRYAMLSESFVNEGWHCADGLCSMAEILKKLPQEKDKLIPQMLPILEYYSKFPTDENPFFHCTGDVQAGGILYTATAIATTDEKYAPRMLKLFEDKDIQEWLREDCFREAACKYLEEILNKNPSLAQDIQRISKGYTGEGESGAYNKLQASLAPHLEEIELQQKEAERQKKLAEKHEKWVQAKEEQEKKRQEEERRAKLIEESEKRRQEAEAKEKERLEQATLLQKQNDLIKAHDKKVEDRIIKQLSASYVDYVLKGGSSKFYPPKKDINEALTMVDDVIILDKTFVENVLLDAMDLNHFKNVDEKILNTFEQHVTTKMADSQDVIQTITRARTDLGQKKPPLVLEKEITK